MADYNIYIHSIGGGDSLSPTTPWGTTSEDKTSGAVFSSGGATTSWESKALNIVGRSAQIVSNPDSIIGSAIQNVAKAFPIVAAAIAVVQVATSIADEVNDCHPIQTGDYRGQVQWNNFKASSNILLHPVSTGINAWKQREQWEVEEKRKSQQRELLGDSIINSYTKRGV